jgi:hypothetical protein
MGSYVAIGNWKYFNDPSEDFNVNLLASSEETRKTTLDKRIVLDIIPGLLK